jgi:hypothetical protein
MTITTPATWDETLHSRISDGTFAEKAQSQPEVFLLREGGEPEWDNDYAPRFRMPENHLALGVKKIDQANARLAKLGIEDRFTYEVEMTTENRNGCTYQYATITLNRPKIGYDGWSFAGAHDFTPAGEVLNFRSAPGAPRVTDNHCDHCGSNRARSRVYTVEHPEKGTMQVGASCLEAFLGTSPKGLWALDSDLDLDKIEEVSGGIYDMRSRVYDPEDLLLAALAASDDGKNFVSASRGDFLNKPTAVLVREKWLELQATGDTKQRRVLARKIIRWARKLDDQPGSYSDNLRAVYAGKKEGVWIKGKHLGMAVSAVGGYMRAQDDVARVVMVAKQKVEDQKEYLAAPKEKLADLEATIRVAHHDESNFGYHPTPTTLLVMVTESGHVLKWGASGDHDLKAGDKIRLTTASVKANAIYEGTHQTIITRAKYEKIAD